jgi:hypothetical protein
MESALHGLKVELLECFSAFLCVRAVVNYAVFDSQFLVLVSDGVRMTSSISLLGGST